jgi:catechol 2,3-dioxygenase-like lactoylglutathione lyase family enzyme
MSHTETAPAQKPEGHALDFKLEIVVVPVTDVDRAKRFYTSLGWREDADFAASDEFRVVQVTPPGSEASIIFGKGVTSATPGSVEDLQLTVFDIDKARDELVARGVAVSEVFHDAGGVFHHAGTEARVTGLLAFTHVGKYQGDIVAANLLGDPREAHYEAVPRVVYTDPQAGAVGATEARFSGSATVSNVSKTATYTRAYAESNGFLTLLSEGERLTGAYALGPEAGEWLQQATLAIRAGVPLDVLRDTIQPFPTFSEIYVAALKSLRSELAATREPIGARPES